MRNLNFRRPTSGRVVLCSKLVDGRCQVQTLVPLVDLAVRSFPWFSPKLSQIRARIPQKDPHRGHSNFSPRSHKRTIGLKPTTKQLVIKRIFLAKNPGLISEA